MHRNKDSSHRLHRDSHDAGSVARPIRQAAPGKGARTGKLAVAQSDDDASGIEQAAPIQRRATESPGHDSNAGTWEQALVRPDLHGPSNPGMPEGVQAKMEHAFQSDFSGVEIHPSSANADTMGAAAFTRGESIHFAPGRYDPFGQAGQTLLGHELAHVVQQRQGRVAAPVQAKEHGMAINSDAGLEREADDFGARAARGEVVPTSGGASARSAPSAAAAQFEWATNSDGKTDPDDGTAFTHANVHEGSGLAFTAYWHPGLGEDSIWVQDKGSETLTKQEASSHNKYYSKIRRDSHPWAPLTKANPNIGIGKPRGSGGTRTISGKDAEYAVEGGSTMLLHFLAQLDDYASDPSTTTERISYGTDVPTLKSTLPIAEVGKPTEGDYLRETIPSSLSSKAMVEKSVLGNYIDAKLLDSWQGNRQTDGNADQGQVMEELDEVNDGSATQVAKMIGFPEIVGGHGWEWLHLKAYSMGGHQGYAQYNENLVLGTWHANSAHLTIESAIKSLAWKTNEAILVDVTADYYKGTQAATTIHYNLATSEGRKMHFEIDCLTRVRPTSHDEKYWFMLIADALLSGEEKLRVLEDRVKDDKGKKDEKDAVTRPALTMCPPSPPHYSQMSQSQLEEKHPAEIVVEGKKRKRDELEEERKGHKGRSKLGAVFSSSNTTDWLSKLPTEEEESTETDKGDGKANKKRRVDKELGLDTLNELFADGICHQILTDIMRSGQYLGNKYTANDGGTWQITEADASTRTLTFTKRT